MDEKPTNSEHDAEPSPETPPVIENTETEPVPSPDHTPPQDEPIAPAPDVAPSPQPIDPSEPPTPPPEPESATPKPIQDVQPVVQPEVTHLPSEQPTVPEQAPINDKFEDRNVVIPTSTEVQPAPQPTPPEVSNPAGIPPAVLALTPEELKIAAQLYSITRQKELSAKGVAKRQARMRANHDKIVAFLTTNSPSPLARIAYAINCSPGTTSGYLQDLVASKRIKASGHATIRRYFV